MSKDSLSEANAPNETRHARKTDAVRQNEAAVIASLNAVATLKPNPQGKTADALLGVKRDLLNNWVCEKKVTAKKGDKIVLYKFADIVATIEFLPNKEFK